MSPISPVLLALSSPIAAALPSAPRPLSESLTIVDLVVGAGPSLEDGALATVAYVGWRGSEVWDTTSDRGPARLLLGDARVPSSWSEGLAGMRVGGVRQLLWSDPDDSDRKDPPPPLITEFTLLAVASPPLPENAPGRERDGYHLADLRPGSGPPAAIGDTVAFDYVLWLEDGTEVDTSWRWPEALHTSLGSALRWSAPIVGMRAGGRRQVRIPPALAYGAEGRPPEIEPDATLILTIDLHAVE